MKESVSAFIFALFIFIIFGAYLGVVSLVLDFFGVWAGGITALFIPVWFMLFGILRGWFR